MKFIYTLGKFFKYHLYLNTTKEINMNMNMKKHLLVAGVGISLSFSGWADFSGTYDCEWTHHGIPRTSQITTVKNGDNYEFTMHEDGKPDVKDALLASSKPNIFLNGWKSQNHIGISTWTFSDDGLQIESKHRSVDLKDEDIIKNCKLHK